MTSRTLPASQRALPIVWPELVTSSCGQVLAVGVDRLGKAPQQPSAVARARPAATSANALRDRAIAASVGFGIVQVDRRHDLLRSPG